MRCQRCGESGSWNSVRFIGDRTAKVCDRCSNDWSRRLAGGGTAEADAAREYHVAHFPLSLSLTTDADREWVANVIAERTDRALAATRTLGELWDRWVTARPGSHPE